MMMENANHRANVPRATQRPCAVPLLMLLLWLLSLSLSLCQDKDGGLDVGSLATQTPLTASREMSSLREQLDQQQQQTRQVLAQLMLVREQLISETNARMDAQVSEPPFPGPRGPGHWSSGNYDNFPSLSFHFLALAQARIQQLLQQNRELLEHIASLGGYHEPDRPGLSATAIGIAPQVRVH